MYDKVPPEAGAQTLLLGKGKVLSLCQGWQLKAHEAVLRYLEDYSESTISDAWSVADVDAAFARTSKEERNTGVLMYHRAEVNEEFMASVGYGRSRTRVNYMILVHYGDVVYVGKVLHFLKVPHPDGQVPPLRLAMCTFFDPAEEVGRAWRVNTQQVHDEYYAVDTATIAHKLVVAYPGGKETGGEMVCMPYHSQTSR